MISYNNSDIIQCLRQYDMFASSLKLVYSDEERQKIINQLNKLIEKNLNLTDEIYKEEYRNLVNRESTVLEEEKNRLSLLIELINQRISYVENQCQNHYKLTNEKIDYPKVMGYDTLDELENKIRIINKYSKNDKTKSDLRKEIDEIEGKIDLAKEKIQINDSLNKELEKKLVLLLDDIFSENEYQELLQNKNDIIANYEEITYLYDKSEDNVTIAREKDSEYLIDCQSLAIDMKRRYKEIDNKLNIINLMEFYPQECNTYDELLIKREKINSIITHITDDNLLFKIKPEIDKQYLTIKKEEQDENTYNELVNEVNKNKEIISEIEEENNSYEFQEVLGKILENERKRQQLIMEEENRRKEEERQKQLEIERKRQEEISKRQKLIEESRKKDIERRTKQLLEEQNNSVLNNKKEDFNFAKLKEDISDNYIPDSRYEEPSSIEKELFEEFEKNKNNTPEEELSLGEPQKEENIPNDNSFPNGSLDDYMKSFNENKINDLSLESILGDDFFPDIPE